MIKKLLTYGIIISFAFVSCKNEEKKSLTVESTDTLVEETPATVSEADEYRILSSKELDELNHVIINKKLTTPQAILNEYAPKDTRNRSTEYTYEVTRVKSDENITLLLLTERNIKNDALKSKKVLMRIVSKEGVLQVDQIKESYQCWEWRGHQDWSSTACL